LFDVKSLPNRAKVLARNEGSGKGPIREARDARHLGNGVIILFVLALLDRSPLDSLKTDFLTLPILLPIFLLGAYLTAHWQWQDLQKKYPEDRLPPWE